MRPIIEIFHIFLCFSENHLEKQKEKVTNAITYIVIFISKLNRDKERVHLFAKRWYILNIDTSYHRSGGISVAFICLLITGLKYLGSFNCLNCSMKVVYYIFTSTPGVVRIHFRTNPRTQIFEKISFFLILWGP